MKKKSNKGSAEGQKVSDQIFLVHRKTSREVGIVSYIDQGIVTHRVG